MGYTGLTESSTKVIERDKVLGICRDMRGHILEVNPEGIGRSLTLFIYQFVDFDHRIVICFEKEGVTE